MLKTRIQFFSSPIAPLLLVNFIGALGYGIILPFLAFLVIDFGGDEVLYGMIAAVYPLFQMIGAPVLGSWSDSIGRKKVLFVSQAGTLLSWLIFLVSFYLPEESLLSFPLGRSGIVNLTLPILVIIVARSLDGLTGGNISVANAYLADITDRKDRKKYYAQMAASASFGFILGPAAAGILASLPNGNFITVVITSLIALAGLLAIHFLLPDVRQKKNKQPDPQPDQAALANEKVDAGSSKKKYAWLEVVTQQYAPLMILLYFLIFIAFNLFYATFSMHLAVAMEWSPQRLGWFFTVLSGVMILTQGPLMTWLSTRFDFSDERLFILGSFLMALTFVCFAQPENEIIFLGAVLFGFGNGIMWPSYLSILSRTGSQDRQGSLQGIAQGSGSLASIIGLLVGGFLLSVISQNLYYLSAGILVIIAILGIGYNQILTRDLVKSGAK